MLFLDWLENRVERAISGEEPPTDDEIAEVSSAMVEPSHLEAGEEPASE